MAGVAPGRVRGAGSIGMPPDPNPARTAPRSGAPARHAASTAASTHAAWPFGLFAPRPDDVVAVDRGPGHHVLAESRAPTHGTSSAFTPVVCVSIGA